MNYTCGNCTAAGHNVRTCPEPLRPDAGFNQAAYIKKRRAEARAKGKCGACFFRWARSGEFRCDWCAERHKEYSINRLRRLEAQS